MRFFLLVFVASLAVAADAPKLEFDQTVFDVGKTMEGREHSGKFTFRNTGNADLKIETPETSCGCTVASVKPDLVRPGGSGEIDFKLNLTDVRGAFQKAITVPSNDPDQPTATLAITGDAKPLFEIEPQIVLFGDVLPGQESSVSIRVRRLDGKKLAIAHADGSRDFLKVSVEPVSDTEARLLVKTKGTGRPERFADIVEATLEGVDKPAFHLPVAGEFLASLKVEPAVIVWNVPDHEHWPTNEDAAATVRKLKISATFTNQPLAVGNFASTAEELLVKVVEIKTGQVYEVTLKFAGPPAQSTQEWLTFDTDLADRPTVAVPLRINVKPPSLPDVPLP